MMHDLSCTTIFHNCLLDHISLVIRNSVALPSILKLFYPVDNRPTNTDIYPVRTKSCRSYLKTLMINLKPKTFSLGDHVSNGASCVTATV